MRNVLLALSAILTSVACGSSSFDGTQADGAVPAADADNGQAPGSTPVNGGGGSSSGSNGSSSSSTSGGTGQEQTAPKTVTTKETVQVGEHARTFTVVAPINVVAGKSYPVVFVFHGDGGDGAGMHAAFPLETISGDAAVLVYPDGRDASWDLYTPEASNEDAAFVDAMVATLKTKLTIDETRIFGSGYSSGAFFINQVACRRSGFFRAIAPNAGGAPQEPQDPTASYWSGSYTKCANQTGGVAALVMHGDQDFVVGTTSGDYDAKYWATVNGCDASEDDRVASTPAPCVEHAGCPADKRVVYCQIPGLGHVVWTESMKATWAFFTAQ